MILEVAIPAPKFSLSDENNKIHNLHDYAGQTVLLYFYPKDDTPGCTTEACNFRDDYSAYQEAGVVILGVSPDSPEKHTKFKAKYELPFTLLADTDHQVCELYGVWGPKKFMGREYEGVHRTTYLIGPDGIIQQVFENVKPANHSTEILTLIQTE
ncbi:thioredoxin-dependent thiol peroxidase [Chloroflexota bacterium]